MLWLAFCLKPAWGCKPSNSLICWVLTTTAPQFINGRTTTRMATKPATTAQFPVVDAAALELAMAIEAAPTWTPEKVGDILQGTVVTVKRREHPEWGPYPYLVLSTPDGFIGWACIGTVPLQQLTALRPVKGDHVAIKDLGKTRGRKPKADGSPNDYHHTVIVKNGEVQSAEWSFEDSPES